MLYIVMWMIQSGFVMLEIDQNIGLVQNYVNQNLASLSSIW